jgi:hypothetical protein
MAGDLYPSVAMLDHAPNPFVGKFKSRIRDTQAQLSEKSWFSFAAHADKQDGRRLFWVSHLASRTIRKKSPRPASQQRHVLPVGEVRMNAVRSPYSQGSSHR